jgi:hypothetical protein
MKIGGKYKTISLKPSKSSVLMAYCLSTWGKIMVIAGEYKNILSLLAKKFL